MIYLTDLIDHGIKISNFVFDFKLFPIFIWFELSKLQNALSKVYIIWYLLLSANILERTYGLIVLIFKVLFFSPCNLLILRRQRRIVE